MNKDIKNKLSKTALLHYTDNKDITVKSTKKTFIKNYKKTKKIWKYHFKQTIISEKLLLKLSLNFFSILHIKKEKNNNQTQMIINLLKNKPIIYYQGLGTTMHKETWKQADIWKKYVKTYQLNMNNIQTYKILKSFKEHNKKIADCMVINYQKYPNVYKGNKILNKFFKSHKLKKINQLKIKLYNQKKEKKLLIIIFKKGVFEYDTN